MFTMNGSGGAMNMIWRIGQNQGDQWFIARVPTDYTYDYKIIFEGIVGASYLGDVVSL